MKKAEKSSSEARKKMERSQPYKSEKEKTKKEAMIESLAEVREHNRLKEQLHTAAMKSSKYAEVYSLYKEEKEISNYDDELLTYDIRTGKIESVYRPKPGKFIGDTELHFDADRIMFTSFRDMDKMKQVDGRGRGYAVVEIGIDPVTGKMRKGPRIVSPDMGSDVDCYDACYLPDDKISLQRQGEQ